MGKKLCVEIIHVELTNTTAKDKKCMNELVHHTENNLDPAYPTFDIICLVTAFSKNQK